MQTIYHRRHSLLDHLLELPSCCHRAATADCKAAHGPEEGDVAVAPHIDHVVAWVLPALELELVVLKHGQQLDGVHAQGLQMVDLQRKDGAGVDDCCLGCNWCLVLPKPHCSTVYSCLPLCFIANIPACNHAEAGIAICSSCDMKHMLPACMTRLFAAHKALLYVCAPCL